MNLKTRLNIALGACAVVAVMVAGVVMQGQMRQRALAEVQREAELHMEAATALRSFTAEHVRPLLNHDPAQFQAPGVPSFAATTTMRELHRRYPGVSYREVALNPINPANLATGIAADIVRSLREQPAETIQREAVVDGQRLLFVAKPMRVQEASCLTCHGDPAQSPPAMRVIYGDTHGFGWRMGETVGAQIVAVPMAPPLERAQQSLLQFLIGACAVVLAVFLALNAMLRRVLLNPIASRHGELQRQAREDELTGAINRRGFLEAAQAGLDHARQCGQPASLAMLDVDRFKQINDQHGHAVGDAVLCELVRRVQSRVRTTDLLGRLGGDEFALLLVGDDLAQARALADDLLARLQDEPLAHGGALGVSIGLAQWDGLEDLAGLLVRADRALYEAKRGGRGRVSG